MFWLLAVSVKRVLYAPNLTSSNLSPKRCRLAKALYHEKLAKNLAEGVDPLSWAQSKPTLGVCLRFCSGFKPVRLGSLRVHKL